MTISSAVLEIARRYGIEVEVSPYRLEYVKDEKAGVTVFGGAGLSLRERKVWLHESIDIEAQLHEVAHIITHPPGCRLSIVRENYLLMQVERRIALAMFTPSEFRRVVAWQRETVVHDEEELNEAGNYRSDPLWREGFVRAKKLGLLTSNLQPTFAKPVWPEDPVEMYYRWMSEHDVMHSTLTKDELRE